MAFATTAVISSLLLLLSGGSLLISADPEELQDFCVADMKAASSTFINGLPCMNPNQVSEKHFVTSVLAKAGNTGGNPFGVSVIGTTAADLPGINTQGLIMARVDLAPGATLPLHTHPRASEMVFVVEGALNAGFVDTNNKLFSAEIKAGDVFVFPKGPMHFLHNMGTTPAFVIAALNSQAPGILTTSSASFASNPPIPAQVLTNSFQVTPEEVANIRKKLGGT